MRYEFVGIGAITIGEVDAWQVTYEKAPAKEEGGIPDFHHHIFPATIFAAAAEQFGLDVDGDWDEVFDIVMHDSLAGDDVPEDDVDPPKNKRTQVKHNELGRKMRRRADRAKRQHNVTGLDAARQALHPHRRKGTDTLAARIERLEAARLKRGVPNIVTR
jgi:hypothetical protein